MPILLPRSAVLSSSSRRSETAFVSLRRSSAISRRSSGSVGIAQRLRRQLGLLECLLGDRLRALLQHLDADETEDCADQNQLAANDQEGGPDREHGRQTGGLCREQEAQRQEAENYGAAGEANAHGERLCLLLQLGCCELQLELDERARMVSYALGCAGKSVHG